jgi:hypothetical protein
MKFKHAVVALATFVSGAAFATPAPTLPGGNLGVLSASPSAFASASFLSRPFSDAYQFTLGALSDIHGSVVDGGALFSSLGFSTGTASFSTAATGAPASTVVIDPLGHFMFTNLAVGTYWLTISGAFNVPPSAQIPASYTGSVYATALTTPGGGVVPEPASLALALAGLGVAGFMLRRRGNA